MRAICRLVMLREQDFRPLLNEIGARRFLIKKVPKGSYRLILKLIRESITCSVLDSRHLPLSSGLLFTKSINFTKTGFFLGGWGPLIEVQSREECIRIR